MRHQSIWLASVLALGVNAFRDTSPFFAFSTSNLLNLVGFEAQEYQTQLSSQVSASILRSLNDCPTDVYVVISQPEVCAKDFQHRNAAPHLRKRVNLIEDGILSTVTVPDVVGSVDLTSVRSYLETQCKAITQSIDAASGIIKSNNSYPQIILMNFPPLPSTSNERASTLAEHDSFLNALLDPLSSYTVLYTTSPPPQAIQESQAISPDPSYMWDYTEGEHFSSVLHTDLKRDLRSYTRQAGNATASNSTVPLFEKYNFLSPGLFMGILTMILLFSILYVGVSAVASLQVSYFAFSKEMNPANQKKAQ